MSVLFISLWSNKQTRRLQEHHGRCLIGIENGRISKGNLGVEILQYREQQCHLLVAGGCDKCVAKKSSMSKMRRNLCLLSNVTSITCFACHHVCRCVFVCGRERHVWEKWSRQLEFQYELLMSFLIFMMNHSECSCDKDKSTTILCSTNILWWDVSIHELIHALQFRGTYRRIFVQDLFVLSLW